MVECFSSGLLWIECKQMYHCGLRVYLLDNYNWMDFVILSLYLSSYMLRFLVDHWIKQADIFYNGTARARDALLSHNYTLYEHIQCEILCNKTVNATSYFMKACKYRSLRCHRSIAAKSTKMYRLFREDEISGRWRTHRFTANVAALIIYFLYDLVHRHRPSLVSSSSLTILCDDRDH